MSPADLILLIGDALAGDHPKVPVVKPGTPKSVLPCVVLEPGNDELGPGNRSLRCGFLVKILVPRFNQVEQYELLCELEAIVLQALIPSEVQFDGPFVFATIGEDTGEPPALARTIPVTFAADVDLCP